MLKKKNKGTRIHVNVYYTQFTLDVYKLPDMTCGLAS